MPAQLGNQNVNRLLAQIAVCRRSLVALSDDLLRCEGALTQIENEVSRLTRPDPPAGVCAEPCKPTDRLIDFREVMQLLGLRCKTGHTARALAARGQIRMVRINDRTFRFSEASVRELMAGRDVVG